MWMGKNDIALSHLNQALSGFQTVGDRSMVGVTLRSLGSFASTKKDFFAAGILIRHYNIKTYSSISRRYCNMKIISHLIITRCTLL